MYNIMYVLCIVYNFIRILFLLFAGPGKETYTKGAGGAKGHDGGEEKLYCQVHVGDYKCELRTILHNYHNISVNTSCGFH